MADRTPFADLTRLDPQDPLSADGFGLQTRNPTLLDYYMRLLFTGRHDGHAALANPAVAPTLSVDDTLGGQIPSDLTITVGYTLTDADGGETALSPLDDVETQAGLVSPDNSPTLALDNVAGTLLAGSYDYAVTLTDGLGGETALSPISTLLIPSGNANNEIVVGALDTITAAQGAAGWRLWRSINDEDWHLIGQGLAAAGTFTDDGSHAADCGVSPPQFDGQTNSTGRLIVTVPGGQGARTVSYNIYASLTGAFDQPSLLATYPVAEINQPKPFDTLTFIGSTPPEVSTAMAGLPKIGAAELESGGGGGGGGTGPLPVMPPWYMVAPEDNLGIPDATNSFQWIDGIKPVAALWMQYDSGEEYAGESYNGEYTPANYTGATTHFHLDGSDDLTLVDAGNWRIRVAENYAVGNWIEAQLGGYVEFDYTIVTADWVKLSADIQSLSSMPGGVRAEIDQAAGTFSLINIADGSVIASVGAAEGYAPPGVGDSGSMVVGIYFDHVVAYDAHDGVAGPALIDVTLDTPIMAVVNQGMGAFGVNATDPTAVVIDYIAQGNDHIIKSIRLGFYSMFGAGMDQTVTVWSATSGSAGGGGLTPQPWQRLGDVDTAPYALDNGWTVVDPLTSGGDFLAYRISATGDELQIRGSLDGSAATDEVIATMAGGPGMSVAGDTEHPVVLVSGGGVRSTGYVKVGADLTISLVQPAIPVADTVLINVTVPLLG